MSSRGSQLAVSEPELDTTRSPWGKRITAGIAVLGLALVLWRFGPQIQAQLQAFASWVDALGPWGPLAFMGGYVLAVIAFVPGLLLTLGGGLLFGVAAGTLYVFVAATLGACCAFLIARYVARGPVERRLEGNERFAAIDHAIGREGRKITFLLRLSPVFPFNLLNYALGLTRVRLVDYAVASIGMLPATIVYVYVGSLLGDIAQLGTGAAASNEDTALLRQGLSVVGLAATIAVTVVITRTARRALAQATEEGVFVQERERA